jgi:hypothetical protein
VAFSLNPRVKAKCDELGVDVLETSLLPNKELIAFRATCARVADLSGARDHKGKLGWKLGHHEVVSPDGSADLISALMSSRLGLEGMGRSIKRC